MNHKLITAAGALPVERRGTSLQEQGFRFVSRAGRFFWCHPAEIREDDIDCTDMDDDTFANTVLASNAEVRGCAHHETLNGERHE